ncbi:MULTISPECIES: NEAT domain-containing protein [unclassified Companilactobacillus]|uniref:NEAT domain-containing protein n=1 Tax=unclassified Companilactobacillus TaxID=2767904 RepID=UPI002FF13419
MKKWVISLLSVGMLLGVFSATGFNSVAPNQSIVQADTNNNERTINYQVYKTGSDDKSPADVYFTKSADVTTNSDGTHKVTMTAEVSKLTGLEIPTINGQKPSVSATYTRDGKKYVDISFKVNKLADLNNSIDGTVQTKLLNFKMDQNSVDFKFDSSSLDSSGAASSFAASLHKITEAENQVQTNLDAANDVLDNTTDDTDENDDEDIIDTPQTAKNSDNKTILKELTYKIAKNNGDGALISPYFTNTAKVIQNPDGSYYAEVTVKYPKKFGNTAVKVNYVNNAKPVNLSFTSIGDSNYLKFDFPINNLTDLSNLIPGNISLDIPDFGIDKDVDFNLDFDSMNPSDLSNLTDDSDLSGLLSNMSGLKTGDVKIETVKEPKKQTLPQAGNETNNGLAVIGGLLLIMWIALIKETYVKK